MRINISKVKYSFFCIVSKFNKKKFIKEKRLPREFAPIKLIKISHYFLISLFFNIKWQLNIKKILDN